MKLFIINIISIIFFQVTGEKIDIIFKVHNGSVEVTEKVENGAEMVSGTQEKCPKNMGLVPVLKNEENNSTWICDCNVPSFLYFVENNSCYQSYKQGPCPPGNYLILPPEGNLAKCEKNPCLEDGLVPFKNTCALLFGKGAPCYLRYSLTINPETFELMCSMRQFNIIKAPEINCPRGSRRNTLGVCKKELK